MKRWLASKLLELGQLPDPRLTDMRAVDIRDIPYNRTMRAPKPRPMTDREIDKVLRDYFARR